MRQPLRVKGSGQAGFTLIELLVVTVVIGILVATTIPGLLNALDKSKQTSTATLLRGFGVAIEAYGVDNQGYPIAADTVTLIPQLRPYSDSLRPIDDWKHSLSYVTDGRHYTVQSFGKDGIDGEDVTPETRFIFALDIVYSDGGFVASVQ